jgi:predicted CXXCH cytochrome family protein
MYTHGITCSSCHDVHGTANNADLLKPANILCLQCHGPKSFNGPHTASIEEHTHHREESAGNECIACHMPRIAQTIANVNVRSHTFRFITPAATESLKVPNACNGCHTDKLTKWATGHLKSWAQFSPWRVGN